MIDWIPLRRGALIGTVVVVLVAAACVWLGFWQLDRRQQREALNAERAQRMSHRPVALDGGLPIDTSGMLYRRVTIRGVYDDARTLVLAGRSRRGVPGVHVYSPVRVQDGAAILVNRGWLPSPDAASVDLEPLDARDTVALQGLVMPLPEWEREPEARTAIRAARADSAGALTGAAGAASFRRVWYRFDTDRVRRQFPYPVAPVYVRALPSANAPRRPVRLDAPELEAGPHLGYAIQWFSFAVIAVVGWTALMWKAEFKKGDARSPSAGATPGNNAASS